MGRKGKICQGMWANQFNPFLIEDSGQPHSPSVCTPPKSNTSLLKIEEREV